MKHVSFVLAALLFFAPVPSQGGEAKPVRVLIWDEQQPDQKRACGGKFLGETIAAHLGAQPGITVTIKNLRSPEQGVDLAKGRVVYFRPGHEIYPIYQQAEPLLVIENAVRWLGEQSK